MDVSLSYGDYYFVEALRRFAETYRGTTLTYRPDADFVGTDTFSYLACDNAGECAVATVTVVVEPPPFTATVTREAGTGWPTLSFATVVYCRYDVEYLDDLAALGSWSTLGSNIVGSGSIMSFTDTNPAPHRFYRVAAELE
jgi:hypothetical protein